MTPIGQMLAKLPVDIVIGKMLIMGTVFHVSIYSGKLFQGVQFSTDRQYLHHFVGVIFLPMLNYDHAHCEIMLLLRI